MKNLNLENRLLELRKNEDKIILFLIYKIENYNFLYKLYSVLEILNDFIPNAQIEIKVMVKSNICTQNKYKIEYIYDNENLLWNSIRNNNLNGLFEDKNFDIAIYYLNVVLLDTIINNKKIKYKLAYIDENYELYNFNYDKGFITNIYSNMYLMLFEKNETKNKYINEFGNQENIYESEMRNENFVEQDYINENMEQEINILCVGRMSSEKGIDRIIKIHKRLLDENIKNKLTIIGEGWSFFEMKNLINRLNINDTCILKGYTDNPFVEINNCDIVVSPSYQEGLGLVIAEAMALYKPIVATKTHGSIELLKYEYGLITENNDESLYEGIKNMIKDKSLRNLYHERLEKDIDNYFNKEIIMSKIENLFGEADFKKNILIVMFGMWSGGSEKALINILNNLNYDKYNVDLQLLINSTNRIEEIDKNVNILEPLYDSFEEIEKYYYYGKSKLKIEKEYDIEIGFLGQETLEDITIYNKSGAKKIFWLHGAIEFIAKNNKSREEMRNLFSYIDTVVCVSEGVKDEFINYIGSDFEDKVEVIGIPIEVDDIRKKAKIDI